MINPKSLQNLIPAAKGDIRNPAGKPKGTKHINTWVQELVEDESFKTLIREGRELKEFAGAPVKAMIKAQIHLAIHGEAGVATNAFNSLVKAGWSQKIEQDITSKGEQIGAELSADRFEQLIKARAGRTDI